ncbi:MAG: S41 family peptidase [Anaerolineales bacterium]|nr:S41 family peptidase [Anaerolineales bacterium]
MAAFAVLDLIFLTAAFLTGYLVRAVSAELPLALPFTAGGGRYALLDEVRALLADHYIGPLPDDNTLAYGAVRGYTAAVGDPYTVFVEPQAHELETQSLQGEYGGIGVNLTVNAAGEIVLDPYRDSPAARAGVLSGDILLAVDDTFLAPGTPVDTATALVRGLVGTMLRMTVRHADGAEGVLTLTRERFEIPSTTWKVLPDAPAIGLIAVSRFSGKTPTEVQQALQELQAAGATSFVLDLRNNGGGILEAAVAVAGVFLDGGVVMYETQHAAPEKTYSAPANAGSAAQAPLVVLVNHNTASAAEIVAGALLDRGRAPLVGQPTYGKGSVQLVYDLSDGSSLHVTAYRWYTPARHEIEDGGLPPTYVVDPATDGSDAELAYAMRVLRALASSPPAPIAVDGEP